MLPTKDTHTLQAAAFINMSCCQHLVKHQWCKHAPIHPTITYNHSPMTTSQYTTTYTHLHNKHTLTPTSTRTTATAARAAQAASPHDQSTSNYVQATNNTTIQKPKWPHTHSHSNTLPRNLKATMRTHTHTHNNQMCMFSPKVLFAAAGASRVQSVSEQLRSFAL